MPKVINENTIFKSVVELLVSQGYEGARTKEVAKLAGVNEATIFRKYGSKANLFEKAIRHQLSDTPLNKLVYTGDLQADLEAIVQAYLETNRQHGGIIPAMLADLPRHPELQEALTIILDNIQPAAEILYTYQVNGELKEEPPIASLSGLISPLMTSQMLRRAAPELFAMDLDPHQHVQAFLSGRRA